MSQNNYNAVLFIFFVLTLISNSICQENTYFPKCGVYDDKVVPKVLEGIPLNENDLSYKRNLDSGSEIIIVQSDALRINDYTNQTEYLVYLVNEGINSINNIDISSDKNVNIYYPLRNINENISNIINISKKGIDISDINLQLFSQKFIFKK